MIGVVVPAEDRSRPVNPRSVSFRDIPVVSLACTKLYVSGGVEKIVIDNVVICVIQIYNSRICSRCKLLESVESYVRAVCIPRQ